MRIELWTKICLLLMFLTHGANNAALDSFLASLTLFPPSFDPVQLIYVFWSNGTKRCGNTLIIPPNLKCLSRTPPKREKLRKPR